MSKCSLHLYLVATDASLVLRHNNNQEMVDPVPALLHALYGC